MTMLDDIREFHEDVDNFKNVQLDMSLFDVPTLAIIERYYAGFLRAQIQHFPYMLKSQWREMYGKHRSVAHNKLKELLERQVLIQGDFKGCHFVYPATRAMIWFNRDPLAKNMQGNRTDRQLIDSFIRAEYFLTHRNPLYLSSAQAFASVVEILSNIPKEAVETFLPDLSIGHITKHFFTEFGDKISTFGYDSKLVVLEMMKQALDLFSRRNCYIKSVSVSHDNGFHLEMALIHFTDSSTTRYHKIINDLSVICQCFRENSFTLHVLTENDKDYQAVGVQLEKVFKQRDKQKKINRCIECTIHNLKVSRYYQKRDDHNLGIHQSQQKSILAQWNSFAADNDKKERTDDDEGELE